MSVNTLTLIVPGLLDVVDHLDQVPAAELPELHSFSRLLSRGKRRYFAAQDYYSFLFEYFSVDPQTAEFPAAAAVDYLYQQRFSTHATAQQGGGSDKTQRWVMRVDPCYMAADRDQLVLLEAANIDLSYEEATRLVAEINHFFAPYAEENFWKLELSADVSSPLSWFLISDQPIKIHAEPTSLVKGSSVTSRLLSGDNQSSWRRLFNEFQMILHQSEVNILRRQQGRLPVNGVWFWGAGQMVCPMQAMEDSEEYNVFSDDPVVKGLSQMAHLKIHDLPHNTIDLFMLKSNGNAVVIMEHLVEAVRNADVYAWIDLMKLFEQQWLEPLVSALKNKQLNQLNVLTPAGIELKITKGNLNHWWKRIHHYTHFYSELNPGK